MANLLFGEERGRMPIRVACPTYSTIDAFESLKFDGGLMRQLVLVTVTMCLCVLGTACDNPKPKVDPAESFKAFAAAFHAAAQEQLKKPWDDEDDSFRCKMLLVVFDEYEIDVKATDSLISPYTGVIKFKARQADENGKSFSSTWSFPVTATFAYQGETWVLKTAIVTDDGLFAGYGYF